MLETDDVVTLAAGTDIYNVGGIRLGHHAIVSQGAFLCGATHDFDSEKFELVSKPIEVGARAWICARAVVLPGVTCHEGSVLGAASVASRDLEAWTVYAGNPARRIRTRERRSKDVDHRDLSHT